MNNQRTHFVTTTDGARRTSMPSTRTQIYLTDEQRRAIDRRGRRTGAPMARMIREAVDAYLVEDRPNTRNTRDLEGVCGLKLRPPHAEPR